MATTTLNGSKIAGYPLVIDTGLINYKTRIMRKYALDILENWIMRFLGKKFHHLYLQVDI